MKQSEVAKLVTTIWANEGYSREPSDADIALWFAFSQEGAWESYNAAMRAYVVYRTKNPSYRLNPGHITETLDEVRRASSRTFELGMAQVPDHVHQAADFDAAYRAWVQGAAAEHRARAIEAFAAGGPVPGQRQIGA